MVLLQIGQTRFHKSHHFELFEVPYLSDKERPGIGGAALQTKPQSYPSIYARGDVSELPTWVAYDRQVRNEYLIFFIVGRFFILVQKKLFAVPILILAWVYGSGWINTTTCAWSGMWVNITVNVWAGEYHHMCMSGGKKPMYVWVDQYNHICLYEWMGPI